MNCPHCQQATVKVDYRLLHPEIARDKQVDEVWLCQGCDIAYRLTGEELFVEGDLINS